MCLHDITCAPDQTNARVVLCEACGSEGRVYVTDFQHSTWNEPGGWGERDDGPCPYCEGTGGEVIETRPIDEFDLEEMSEQFWVTS